MGYLKGILIMLACTLFTAFGQYFLKLGSSSIISLSLLIGLTLYCFGAVLLIFALKHGELNSLYPIISLTIVWVTAISFFLLKETISASRLIGAGVVLSGVFFVTLGGSR